MKVIFALIFGISLSGSLVAQKHLHVQKDKEATTIALQAGNNTISMVPCSLPDNLSAPVQFETQKETKGIDSYDWDLKFSASGKVFKDISFCDAQVGYIVTELGAVYKSVNGGDNWVSVLNLGFPYYWYGVYALSPDTVVISGFNNQNPIGQGVIRWTFDGGNTWAADINLTIPVSGVGWLERVHFFNADTGIVFNSFSGGCWYTSDGGKEEDSWTYITINPDMGWISGNIDAQPTGQVYATGIHFASSSDFGYEWSSNPSADNVFDGGVDFLDYDNSFGWTGGGTITAPVSGWVHSTVDGGETWGPKLESFPYPIRALKFFDESTGFAVGGNLYDEAGGIYSTQDGGETWNLDISTDAEMFSIESRLISMDSLDVWCVGSTGGGTGYTGKLYKARIVNPLLGVRDNQEKEQQNVWLDQNVPNPFNTVTKIGFRIPVAGYTSLIVFDIMGHEVATLVDGIETPGYKSVELEAAAVAEGVYYYQLRTNNHQETKKLVLRR